VNSGSTDYGNCELKIATVLKAVFFALVDAVPDSVAEIEER
jgi:hypothetical protein